MASLLPLVGKQLTELTMWDFPFGGNLKRTKELKPGTRMSADTDPGSDLSKSNKCKQPPYEIFQFVDKL